MKILFIDCETSGLPLDYKASYQEVNNWPRVLSLAWLLTDEKGEMIRAGCSLVKPVGWKVPTEKFWVDNGYTQERSEKEGIAIEILLEALYQAKKEADLLVAHNLTFDHRIVWAEFIRAGRQPLSGMNKCCTMMKGTSVAKMPAAKGKGYKWPKLGELYQFLFKRSFEGAHDASADVLACKECFFELVKRKAIDLSEYPVIVREAKVVPFDNAVENVNEQREPVSTTDPDFPWAE